MKHNLTLFWICVAMNTLILVVGTGFLLEEFPLTEVVILSVASLYFLGRYEDQYNNEDS